MRTQLCAILLVATLAGCMVGPDYVRPEVDSPQQFRFQDDETRELANTTWWQQFGDPVLDQLIAEALANNKDLRIAAARVEEFAAVFTTTRSEFFPQIGYEAAVSRDRFSERLATPLQSGFKNPQTTNSAVLTASWEIDLWGRIRRLTEAARADVFASEEGRRGVVLSLVSSVAAGYVTLRNLDRQLLIAQRTVGVRKESLNLFQERFRGGVVSRLELAQARSEYEAALVAVPGIEEAIAQTEHALSLLLGRNPGPIPRGKTIEQLVLFPVPTGLPSDLLVRRPDIRQAEQDLIAANARIGAARALYYPSISLTGFFGYASEELSDLFKGPSRSWSFGGSILGPIFTFGRIEGQVRQAEAREQQLVTAYQRTVQNAFREVEDALVSHRKSRERSVSQLRQANALRDYAQLARERYEGGYTSYLEVLDAERSLFNIELQYAQTQSDVFNTLVNVYKTVGGGWVAEADTLAPQPMLGAKPGPRSKQTRRRSAP